jgi:vibriolysin
MRTRVVASILSLPLALVFAGCSVDSGVPDDLDMPGVGEELGLFVSGDDASLTLAAKMGLEKVQSERPEILDGTGEIAARHVRIDQRGWAIDRFAQKVNGVPVFGGELIVHLDRHGAIATVYDYLKRVDVDTKPALVELDARKAAYATVEGVVAREIGTDLQILPRENGDARLTYRVQLEMTNLEGEPSMPVIFVDAHTGEVVWSYDNLQTAKSLKTYTLASKTTFNTATLNLTTTGTTATGTGDAVVTQAHNNANFTYDYYFTKHARDSYNAAGATINSYAHYSTNYVNAYWDSAGARMVYGDGNGVDSTALTVLDVVAHELTHAVTSSESNLTYSGESGGLNEAMSDIFGASVEAFRDNAVSANTWKIGEECWTPATAGDALRYMNDPAADGVSLDLWTSSTGTVDVHYSSGIANLAFKLAITGGTHPRGKTSTNVTALNADPLTSLNMAAKIFYDANANCLSAGSNFAAARTCTINSANTLYGAAAATSIDQAWAAVGVGAAAPPPTGWVALGSASNISVLKSKWVYYTIATPANATALRFSTSGGTGNVALYSRLSVAPTTTTFACKSAVAGNTETCTVNAPSQGTYYIGIYGTAASSGVALTVDYK